MFTNELSKTYLKKLDERIETLDRIILAGPSSDISCEEVSMEYMRRVGQRNEAEELRELYKEVVKTYLS